ncbi:MAG: hypothetical protein ACR2MX_00710 [Cyclobacteriaceae bacterium]
MEEAKVQLTAFIDKLRIRSTKYKDQSQFLRYLFYKVHQKYLSHYRPQSSFTDLLATKEYDCLTGTALYAMILDALDVDHKIVETEFHIFLLVQGKESEILFETTDPLSGFIRDARQVKETITRFSQPTAQNEEAYYQFSFNIYNHIDLRQLAGLHYYNQAVSFYNQQKMELALINLEPSSYTPIPGCKNLKG